MASYYSHEVFKNRHSGSTIVQFFGGKYDGKTMTVEAAKRLPELRGFECDMTEERSRGVCCHYPIFDGAPKFEGYCGPMAGTNVAPLRYETWELYNHLSI